MGTHQQTSSLAKFFCILEVPLAELPHNPSPFSSHGYEQAPWHAGSASEDLAGVSRSEVRSCTLYNPLQRNDRDIQQTTTPWGDDSLVPAKRHLSLIMLSELA